MNILILSDYSRIALDMNANLRMRGFNSVLLTTKHVENQEGVVNVSIFRSKRVIALIDHARAFVYRKILLRSKGLYFQDVSENEYYYSFGRIRKLVPFKPDAVIVLFDYRMITGRTISDLHRWSGAKIIWMMVDMKPYTGGCAYSGSCLKYRTGCHDCPLIGNPLLRKFAHATAAKRRELLKGVDLQMIAGSSLQCEQARSSYLLAEQSVNWMFYPNDERVFKSEGRARARKLLNLPGEMKIVLFGANRFDAEVKGYKYLLRALRTLKDRSSCLDVMLLTVGRGVLPQDIEQMYQVRNLGWVDYNTLSLAYQSAEVFVCPSIEDSGPMMVNQSLMCGTPVVAFKMGVSIDLVTNGKTGFLAELRDSTALAQAMQQILMLSPEERDFVKAECLKVAEALGFRAFVGNLQALLAGSPSSAKEEPDVAD
jgi:glycosyltransferase involved in cell wall biosynthesis